MIKCSRPYLRELDDNAWDHMNDYILSVFQLR